MVTEMHVYILTEREREVRGYNNWVQHMHGNVIKINNIQHAILKYRPSRVAQSVCNGDNIF